MAEVAAGPVERLEVLSGAFAGGQDIPDHHAADADDFSLPVDWSAGPEGTRSYVLLAEDPDVSEPKPFVHWLAYDIPATVTQLGEGLPPQPRLLDPEGALQGQNSFGATGYRGMKPPAGDPAHA
jgi:Raf kinase inhibitor-like YbhB/YbcL family protein